jgi:hypothetical protein
MATGPASAEMSQAEPPLQGAVPGLSLPLRLLMAATVFLGAFLLFLIEPLFAKLILPRFGGSTAVWATCLVFYQSALLLGYFYADASARRLAPRTQSGVHMGLLLISLFWLPIAPQAFWRTHTVVDPAWRILGLLTFSLGLPFVLLSATSPLAQIWYARRASGRSPYHLFAISNLASLLALVSFPFLIEPQLSSHRQAMLWSVVYVLFVAFCALAAWLSRKSAAHATVPNEAQLELDNAAPSWKTKLLWLSLAACGSMMLIAVTNHLTENVAPVPLLWVLPLGF